MVLRYAKAPTQRQLRVGEEIRHALADMFIRNELSHPFFEKIMISISEVRVGPDLKVATAFLVMPDDIDHKALLKLFKDISPTIRKIVGKKVLLRYTPELRFAADESVKYAARIESLLKSVK